MLCSSTVLLAWIARPQAAKPSYLLVYADNTLDSASISKMRSIAKADDLAAYASKLDFPVVELKPGYNAILPNHSKLNNYLSMRERLYKLYLSNGVGKHDTVVDSLVQLASLEESVRNQMTRSFREFGVALGNDSYFQPTVALDLVLVKDSIRMTVPYSHSRRLSSRAESQVKNVTSVYDPTKIPTAGLTDPEAIDTRDNVELSLNSMRVVAWGGIKTNGRAATLGELAFKRLATEFSDLEQRAVRMNTEFLNELGKQGTSWKSITETIGNPMLRANADVYSNLEGSIYGDATRLGLTDRNSVKEFLSKAKLESVHIIIGAAAWVKFQDGKIGRFGIEL